MAAFYITQAYLTDGVSRSARAVSFFMELQKQDKADLIFGVMGLSLFVFLLLPTAGFTQSDHAPYSIENIVKRIFIFAGIGLFPWLMQVYTRKVNNRIPFLISHTVAALIVLYFSPQRIGAKPIWLIFLNHCFAGKKEPVHDDTEEEFQLEILT